MIRFAKKKKKSLWEQQRRRIRTDQKWIPREFPHLREKQSQGAAKQLRGNPREWFCGLEGECLGGDKAWETSPMPQRGQGRQGLNPV